MSPDSDPAAGIELGATKFTCHPAPDNKFCSFTEFETEKSSDAKIKEALVKIDELIMKTPENGKVKA
jgi:hypothetical protein